MTENQNDLKPCACHFCGFETYVPKHSILFQVKCKRCGAVGPHCPTPKEAIALWNTRAASPAERQVEAIRAAMRECTEQFKRYDSPDTFHRDLMALVEMKRAIEKILEEK